MADIPKAKKLRMLADGKARVTDPRIKKMYDQAIARTNKLPT